MFSVVLVDFEVLTSEVDWQGFVGFLLSRDPTDVLSR